MIKMKVNFQSYQLKNKNTNIRDVYEKLENLNFKEFFWEEDRVVIIKFYAHHLLTHHDYKCVISLDDVGNIITASSAKITPKTFIFTFITLALFFVLFDVGSPISIFAACILIPFLAFLRDSVPVYGREKLQKILLDLDIIERPEEPFPLENNQRRYKIKKPDFQLQNIYEKLKEKSFPKSSLDKNRIHIKNSVGNFSYEASIEIDDYGNIQTEAESKLGIVGFFFIILTLFVIYFAFPDSDIRKIIILIGMIVGFFSLKRFLIKHGLDEIEKPLIDMGVIEEPKETEMEE